MDTKLQNALIDQLGYDSLEEAKDTLKDICRGGANAGFSGFTYSAEMLEFYKKNKHSITRFLAELADDMGQEMNDMIRGFNCLKDTPVSDYELGQILFCNDYDHEMSCVIIDAVCWCAVETLAFENE